jgi:hypothetical protein
MVEVFHSGLFNTNLQRISCKKWHLPKNTERDLKLEAIFPMVDLIIERLRVWIFWAKQDCNEIKG